MVAAFADGVIISRPAWAVENCIWLSGGPHTRNGSRLESISGSGLWKLPS